MSDTVENPWQKRIRGKRKFMPPSRAMLAEKDGLKSTAAWTNEGGWKCISAHGILRWMKGMPHPGDAEYLLKTKGISWQWITPFYGKPIEPPFQPS